MPSIPDNKLACDGKEAKKQKSKRKSTSPRKVCYMRGFPKLKFLYDNLDILTFTSLLNFHPRRAIAKRMLHLPLHLKWNMLAKRSALIDYRCNLNMSYIISKWKGFTDVFGLNQIQIYCFVMIQPTITALQFPVIKFLMTSPTNKNRLRYVSYSPDLTYRFFYNQWTLLFVGRRWYTKHAFNSRK